MNEPQPAFICVALLYEKTSRAGNRLLFGHWNKVRLYAFPTENRKAKDSLPEYRLCVRAEDYAALREKLPPPAVKVET